MSNKKTLVPQAHKLTVDELSKGGKKSVKSKKERKFIRENLEMLMLMDVKDDKVKEKLKHFGIPENEMTLQMAMCVSLVQQAVNGNIKSFQVIGDYLQQNPKFRRR